MQTHIILTSDYPKVYKELMEKGATRQDPFLLLRRQVYLEDEGFYTNTYSDGQAALASINACDVRLYPVGIMNVLNGRTYSAMRMMNADCVILHILDRRQLRDKLPPATYAELFIRLTHVIGGDPKRLIGGPF